MPTESPMPESRFYALFDPQAPSPAAVLGWLDRDLGRHAVWPGKGSLVAVSDEQWEQRTQHRWGVAEGALVILPPTLAMQAATEVEARIALGAIAQFADGQVFPLPLTGAFLAGIAPIARDCAAGLGFPDGKPTYKVPTLRGEEVELSPPQLVAVYIGTRGIFAALQEAATTMRAGGLPSWPPLTYLVPARSDAE